MHQRSGAPLPKQGARGALIAGTAAGTCRLPVSALAAPASPAPAGAAGHAGICCCRAHQDRGRHPSPAQEE